MTRHGADVDRRAEWDDLGHASTERQIAAHFRRY